MQIQKTGKMFPWQQCYGSEIITSIVYMKYFFPMFLHYVFFVEMLIDHRNIVILYICNPAPSHQSGHLKQKNHMASPA